MNNGYYGKVREFYISALFTTAFKVSLSKNISDAMDLDEEQQLWARRHLGAVIVRARIVLEEV
jgi:hypothetical protein